MTDAAWNNMAAIITAIAGFTTALALLAGNLVVGIMTLIKAARTGDQLADNTKKTETIQAKAEDIQQHVNGRLQAAELKINDLEAKLVKSAALLESQDKVHQAELEAQAKLHDAKVKAMELLAPPAPGVTP